LVMYLCVGVSRLVMYLFVRGIDVGHVCINTRPTSIPLTH
jgi:hypothetical protein